MAPTVPAPRRVAISGASGLVGSAVAAALGGRGDTVVRLVRHAPRGAGELAWDPDRGLPDPAPLAGADAVVHLAGANLSRGRWTPARKRLLRASRVDATAALARSLAAIDPPPRALVMASAMGFYGDRGDTPLDEASGPGRGFLAELVRDWEAAAEPARARGIRVVPMRFGLVLSRRGGALAAMLPLFRLGVGGPLGDGRAWWSWVTLDDVVAFTRRAIDDPAVEGPFNVAAPEPVRNRDFAHALGRVLHRPAVLPAPAWALRLALGEMADAALLASARLVPRRALEQGFTFGCPRLPEALTHALAS